MKIDMKTMQSKRFYYLFFENEGRDIETCFDGIKNQDEDGIDCGGTACKSKTCRKF